jgi:hypothetical protein
MNFKELKKETFSILQATEGMGNIDTNSAIARRKNDLKNAFIQNIDGAELERRRLQLEKLGFSSGINQWACFCQSKEEWEKLFDEVEKLTCEDAQRELEKEIKKQEADDKRRKRIEKKKRVLKGTTHKSLVKRIIKKEKKGVALEHTLSYLTHEAIKGNVEIKGDWNAKTRMVLEFVALKFAESAAKLKKDQKEFFENRNAIDEYCKEIQKVKKEIPELFEASVIQITVDPSELRERFNIKDLYTNKQICEIALSIPGTYLKGNTRLYYDHKQKKYLSVQFSCGLCNVGAIKTGKKEKHTGDEKYHLLFKFYEKVSIVFIANIFNLRLNATIPNYYRLPDPDQDIIRIARWQKREPNYSLRELANLFNLKVKHTTRVRHLVENRLNKVVENKGLKNWKATKGRGWKKRYTFKY